MQTTIKDPTNLSSLYFGSSSSSPSSPASPPRRLQPWVASDAFEIVRLDELRGRGMVATRELPAGTCLFVIPPTVSVSFMDVLKVWKKRDGTMQDPSLLEEAADDVLLQEMQRSIQDASLTAVANSFLVLEGAFPTSTIPSMDCLLAKDDGITSTALIRTDASDEELRQIIRRNAFGPDFLSYQSIVINLPKRPCRILGLYPLADMANHSCHPNTVRVYVGEYMVVHTSSNIVQGEEITTSYVPPTFCYPQRQHALQRSHGFTCSCQRCRVEADVWKDPGDDIREAARMQQELSSDDNVLDVVQQLDTTILPHIKPNELQRYLRLGFVPLYTTYLNQRLASSKRGSNDDILRLCMQLHFSFITCNPSSTEHLSILHLAYELISNIHAHPGNDTSKTLPQVKFWTEQVKTACMTRYGKVGNDLDALRKLMQHTRLVLRTKHGMYRATYPFI